MKEERTEGTGGGRKYPMRLVLRVAGYSSAAWYGKRNGENGASREAQRPGPKPAVSDEKLLESIRDVLASGVFHSEGYRKTHARLRRNGVRVGKRRVLAIMKANNLLAPVRPKWTGSSRQHDGTIITELPNQMWGTDGKQFRTEEEGMCWFFGVIDHCNDEIHAWHVAKTGNRYAALEPVREAVRKHYGAITEGIVTDIELFLRSDHGSQYDSDDFQGELKFLGLKHSPAFVRSPECNGIIERFHRTLQEQVFDLYQFRNLEEARRVIGDFIERYNNEWILERLGYRSPVEYRKDQESKKCFLKSA
jgi:putative transposase